MIINVIQEIVKKEEFNGSDSIYIRSAIKEYLQILVLNFLYTDKEYKSKLIFTGGTCLRHFFGLERLSEDLDFDRIGEIDTTKLGNDIKDFFYVTLKYTDLEISIKQQGRQILLKFPILRKLNLSSQSDSDLLYIKLDISEIYGKSYNIENSSKSLFGYNFVALHYDLPSLFAGKIAAILTRNILKDSKKTIKGRDFYDLLWYLKKGVKINLQLLKEKLNDSSINISVLNEKVNEKVQLACTKYKKDFKNDLLPFISKPSFLEKYIDNYSTEISK
ncbi:MAG: nucleotidyl transferase AbiEii/AbiGii toxin family protein, partial [bacterium]